MHSLHDSCHVDVHALCLPIPLLQVSYTKAGKVRRKFCIPSTCKKLVKSIRYRRYPYVARTLLQQPQLKDATLAEIENVIHAECSDLCKLKPKPSELRYLPKAKGLVDFEWKNVESELSKKAPILTLILKAAAQSKGAKRKIRTGIIVMAAALLLKSRNEKMSRVQAINSVLLFAGHANKKVRVRHLEHASETLCISISKVLNRNYL